MEFKNNYSCRVPFDGIKFTEPTRTKQSMKDECDINLILKRYQATGVISHVSSKQPIFADVSNFDTYDKCLAYINKAEDAFNALPSELRLKLDNNPQNLVSFIKDPKNYDDCIRLGIFNKPVKESVPRVEENVGN